MKTKTYNVYSFAELSGPARQRAIENHREFLSQDWNGSDVIGDAKNVLRHAGFTVDRISYSGFWSQGDGASFTGTWAAANVNAKAMRDDCPVDEELHALVDALADIAAKYPALTARIVRTSHHYSHEYTVSVDAENDGADLPPGIEDELTNLARDAMRWIYRELEGSYEAETEELAVIESIEANEYEFTEDGEID